MVASYLEADSEAMFSMLNEMTIFVFSAANMLWLLGMIGVYALEAGWLRVAGMALSAIAGAAFAAMFFGMIGMEEAAGGGVPMLILYVLNAWYGVRVLRQEATVPGPSLEQNC